ncbi:MAG TPA: aldehyde dehydrogenase family protein, partial [Novosphingobium sp.]|nr:aldehyde dehydrogenase family protein [Novosphingobium sp.]
MSTPFRLLIDGALVEGASLLPVVNPALGTPFADAPRADAALLEQAVAAANRAFPAWAARPWAERAAIVGALGDAVEARAD